MAIAFVQAVATDNGSAAASTTVAGTYASAQSVGDVIIVYVGSGSASTLTVSSITDTKGNTYTPVATDSALSGVAYYAIVYQCIVSNSATAGSNTLTVTFGTSQQFNFLLCGEYSGVDNVTPVDSTNTANGSGTAATVSATASFTGDEILGFDIWDTGGNTVGSGFTQRGLCSASGVQYEDKAASGTGSQTANSTGSSAAWLQRIVLLKAAGAASAATPAFIPRPPVDPRNPYVALSQLPGLGKGSLWPVQPVKVKNLAPSFVPQNILDPTTGFLTTLSARPMLGRGVLTPTQPPLRKNNHDPSLIPPTGVDPRNVRLRLRQLPTLGSGVLVASPSASSPNKTGTAAQVLGGLVQSATGSEVFSGTSAQKLGGLRQAATGAETFAGTGAQLLGGLRQAATGSEVFSGTVAQKLGGLAQAATGANVRTASPTFIPPTGVDPRNVRVRIRQLPRLGYGTLLAAPLAGAKSGTAAQNLGGLRQSATGSEVFTGTASHHVGGLRQSATGAESFSGTAAQKLGGLRQSAIGAEVFSGTSAQRLGRLVQAATGVDLFTGSVAQRLMGLRQSATGAAAFVGSAAQRVAGLQQSAAGTVTTGLTILGARGTTTALAYPVAATEPMPGPSGATTALAVPAGATEPIPAPLGATAVLPYPEGTTWPLF